MPVGKFTRLPAIPGIPSAPIGKDVFNEADRYFEEKKQRLGVKLPLLTNAQITERSEKDHVAVLNSLEEYGYKEIVQEINSLLKKEAKDRKVIKIWQYMHHAPLVAQKSKFTFVVDVFKAIDDAVIHNELFMAALARKKCGERMLQDHDIWLAKYFFRTALKQCEKVPEGIPKNRLVAELHCLIAFIIRETEENPELALQFCLKHLQVCRDLSKDSPWLLKANMLSIKLKKPITLLGLREDYETIDGGSMLLYHIATLLEHEMLLGVANHVMHHRGHGLEVTQSVGVFLEASLQLAYLVRQPTALVSSLMRFGTILRNSGDFDTALQYFQLLVRHAQQFAYPESMAIGYHEIALCYIGKMELLVGLDYLVKEKEIGDKYNIPEIQADALQEIAYVLLEEGHLWESEECYFLAWRIFDDIQLKKEAEERREHSRMLREENEEDDDYDYGHGRKNGSEQEPLAPKRKKEPTVDSLDFAERDLVFSGICAGEKLWSQICGLLIHSEDDKTLEDIIEWKTGRKELPPVPRPNYNADLIEDLYEGPRTQEEQLDGEEEEGDSEAAEKKWQAWMNETTSQVERRASRVTSTAARRMNRLQELEESTAVEEEEEVKVVAPPPPNPQEIRQQQLRAIGTAKDIAGGAKSNLISQMKIAKSKKLDDK